MAGYSSKSAHISIVSYDWLTCDPYIMSISSITLSSISDYSITDSTYSTKSQDSISFSSSSQLTISSVAMIYSQGQSDVSMNMDSYSNYNLTTNSISYLFIDLPCSVAGTSTVSYSLSTWYGSSAPSFVSLDTTNLQLNVNTTGIPAGSSYSFGVSITISGVTNTFCKNIDLRVNGWSVSYWTEWEASNSNDCKTWNSGYQLNGNSSLSNNTWALLTNTSSSTSSSTSQAAVSSIVGASAVLSMCNLSAPQGLWMTMDQFQLILLLLLAKANIPQKVVDYLSGMKDTTWSFNLIPFKDIPGISKLIESLDFLLDNNDLKYFGLFSGSFLVNNFSFIWIILIITLFQFFVIPTYLIWSKKSKPDTKKYKIVSRIYQLFALSIYIRLWMETNQFLMMSSLYQIYSWSFINYRHFISFALSLFWIVFVIFLIIVSMIQWRRLMNGYSENKHHYFKEFLSSIKDKPWTRIYTSWMMTRRLLLVSLLILGSSLKSIYIVSTMTVLQIIYLTIVLILRPFKEFKNNLINSLNEVYYLVLILMLVYFNIPERWTDTIATIYMYLVMSNSATIILILTGNR